MVVEGRAICGRPCGPNNEAIILEDCNCVPSINFCKLPISVGLNVRILVNAHNILTALLNVE